MTNDDPNAWRPGAFAAALLVLACPWNRLLGGPSRDEDEAVESGTT